MKLKRQVFFLFLLLLGFFNGFAQNGRDPFFSEILKFKENDKVNPPPQHAILFIGSSSFTQWKDVNDYFPEFIIINRGFGGSILQDQIRYVDDIVFPYSPKQIVIYCGENDLASSDTITSEMVTHRFIILFNLIRSKLPNVGICYVSMKPSPLRWNLADKFMNANKSIGDFLGTKPNTCFINIWDVMLNSNSFPDTSLFLKDMLHMNAKGYSIWQKVIKPHLGD